LEHGAGAHLPDCTDFPWPFAIGAANSFDLTRRMGVATAVEARNKGVNWTLSPCVDLCLNHNNPVVNIRSMGDQPDSVARLATTWIQAMQTHGLAACAKHFPGDGVDDRDQHLCTSINSFDQKTWWITYGKVWRAVIDAGVMSIMSGHISLPAFQCQTDHPVDCLPATLSSELQVKLLRGQLGFQGVIVSDAAPMIGFASRVGAEDAVVQNILAGSDVFLFADPVADFGRLKAAWKNGRLSEGRIQDSVRRILEMKARLGLHQASSRPKLTAVRKKGFEADAARLAEKSMVLYRKNAATPLRLKPEAKVLTVTLRYEKGAEKFLSNLPVVDEELRRRGFDVTHRLNLSHREMFQAAKKFDAVFVNFCIVPHAMMGTVRVIGPALMTLWRAFWLECPQAVFTTFGSPYHIHEFPHLPNYWMACSPSEVSQRAAVRAWLGEIPAKASCPAAMAAAQRGTLKCSRDVGQISIPAKPDSFSLRRPSAGGAGSATGQQNEISKPHAGVISFIAQALSLQTSPSHPA
jgi:beta-N-acetylhexosaminidase